MKRVVVSAERCVGEGKRPDKKKYCVISKKQQRRRGRKKKVEGRMDCD